jgi:myo-inositol-1-phosphate synthase
VRSLIQGVRYFVPGLMHVDLGGYHVRDIEFVAAFDVDREKVGKDLSEATVRRKLALDNGLAGSLEGPSAYFMKSPAQQHTDNDARRLTEEFITTHGRRNGDAAPTERSAAAAQD